MARTNGHERKESGRMDAYEIMRVWDKEAGFAPRSNDELDMDVPGGLTGEYEEWKIALEAGMPDAIAEGRKMWANS